MAGKFLIEAIFKGTDRFSRVLGTIQAKTNRFSSGMASGLRDVDRMTDRVFQGFARLATVGGAAGVGLGAGLWDTVKAGSELEHTLVAAAAKFSPAFRRGTSEFGALKKAAQDVGASTEFGAQAAAAALKDLGAAGLNVNQALAVLPGVIDLGTAAEIGLSDSSTIATKSLGAFNLMTQDTGQLTKNFNRVLDTMARTADMTTADMGGLFETIREGAPVATSAGASVETFLAFAGQLSQAGIDGSVAGTMLKDVFLRLAAPTTEAARALSLLGVKTADSKGNLRDAIDILGDLEKKTAAMGTAKRADVLEQIFGKIPIAGVTALLGAGTAKLRDMRTELEHAGGSMQRMAGIMRDDTRGNLDRLGKSLESVRDAIFDVVEGPLTPMLTGVTAWVRANRELVASGLDHFLTRGIPLVKDFSSGFVNGLRDVLSPLHEVVDGVDGLLGMLPGLGSAASAGERFGKLAGSLLLVAGGIKAVTLAVGALEAVSGASPFTLLAGGVVAVGAALILYGPEIKHWARDHKVLAGVIGGAAVVFLGFASAQRAVAAATWLANGARGALALATRAAAAAETLFTGEITASAAATDGAAASFVAADLALGPLLLGLGALAVILGTVVYNWQELQKVAGGHVWEGIKSYVTGNFSYFDEAQNEDARRRYAAEHAAGGAPPVGPPPLPGAPPPGDNGAGAPALPPVPPQVVGGASAVDPAQLMQLIEALQKQQAAKLEIDVRTEDGVKADVKPKAGSKKPIKLTNSGNTAR
ncbi:MAG TPA: phage tail tape measure protein [Gammaproteobacteria bacterium]|nr:phage tail tape measure protein [Gammaproteobacteria bacterium]